MGRSLVFGLGPLAFAKSYEIRKASPFRGVCDSAQKSKTKDQRPKTIFLIKLFQKANVVFEKESDVIEAVHERTHPIDPKPKRKSRIDFRVNSGDGKHVWVHHARTSQLNPPRILTDTTAFTAALETTEVKFRAWFSKRKIRGSEARNGFRAKHSA
jgi:hypothetical protein